MTAQKSYFVEYKGETYEVYYTSKKGYLIDFIDLEKPSEEWVPKIVDKLEDFDTVVIQLELLPWSLLGKGLIDYQFLPIYLGMKQELDFCKQNGFEEAYLNLLESANQEFIHDKKTLSKSLLKSKYGEAKTEWYSTFLEMSKYLLLIDEQLIELEKYREELEGYIQETEVDFYPFQIMKIERGEQLEVLPFDNYKGFKLLNDAPCLLINLTDDEDYSYDYKKAYVSGVYQRWLRESKELFGFSKLEGVVIKPLDTKLTHVAPYLKVRSPQYLKLTYGPTYNLKPQYSKLLSTKNTSRKLKSSIEEWKLGLEMLSIHSSKLSVENIKAVDLMIKFIAEEKKVEELDPRL